VEPARTRVWFETGGSLFYTHYSPDPLTLVIDLPGVDVSAIAERTVVGSQEVESIVATRLDGTNGKSLSRIEINLASLVPYQVSATEHALTVLFEGAASPAESTAVASAPSELSPEPKEEPEQITSSESAPVELAHEDIESASLASSSAPSIPSVPSQDDLTPPPAAPVTAYKASQPASAIDRVTHTLSDGLLTVSVGADGWLNYTSFRLDNPRRLVFDFTGVLNRVPRQRVPIEAVGVYRARVAQFQSANPLITRIVFDLDGDIPHRAVEQGSELKIFFAASADRLAELVPSAEPDGGMPLSAGTESLTIESSSALAGIGFSEPSQAVASMEPVALVAQTIPLSQVPQVSPESGQAPELPEPPQDTAEVTTAQGRVLQKATIGGEEKEYTGELISLDFKDGDIQDIFRLFADISGLNIVVQPGVTGRVTLVLTEVPWDQALDLILKAHRLGYVVEGNVIRIAPMTELAQEETERRRLAEEQALAGDLSTLLRELSYAKANDVQALVQRNLSARGDIAIDERTNMLIITDLPDRLDNLGTLIDSLDAPIPGVEIAARIVVTTRNFSRNLGVQWGFVSHQDQLFGNSTDLSFPNSVLVDGQSIASNVIEEFRGPTPENTGIQSPLVGAQDAQRGYAVNLPIPTQPTGAIGISLGSITGAFSIDAALSAAERRGRVRIISAPKIITQNNRQATIKQGLTFPVQVVANNTVTVQFKDAVLELLVTPQITSADTVILDIELNNDTADFGQSVNGIPSIITVRAVALQDSSSRELVQSNAD
jgi:type IV pilus assembly protein PilQ